MKEHPVVTSSEISFWRTAIIARQTTDVSRKGLTSYTVGGFAGFPREFRAGPSAGMHKLLINR